MKYLSIIILVFIASSCCGAKKAITSSQNDHIHVNSSEIVSENVIESKNEIEFINETDNEVEEILDSEHTLESGHDTVITQTDSTLYVPHGNWVVSHDKWNHLLQQYVSKTGQVDYNAFKNNSAQLRVYITTLTSIKPHENWSKEHTLVYWINTYNALTIDLIIRNYPLKSIKDIKEPWDQRLWKFGDKWLNLNDIEHQILRKLDEPRIHFAIVCASVSCPKLQNKAFTADGLDEQLTLATKEFLADRSKNQISENSIKLSKIFKWFGKDFKTKNSDLIDFLNQYSSVIISDGAKKSYLDYNWDLNE